ILLLDEPMAGMGPEEAARIQRLLETLKRRRTILLVEHDRAVVFRLADRISTLVYGRVIASGAPDEIRRHPEVRRAYLGEQGPEGPRCSRAKACRRATMASLSCSASISRSCRARP